MVRTVVIIGGGAGGGALAHRLLRDPETSVLLIEAGSDDRPAAVETPARWPETLGGPLDWGYRTTPQAGLGGRVLDYHQGRVLGGTTCLNAMIHAYPPAEELARWGDGWTARDLDRARRELEHHRGGAPGRGHAGPAVNGPVTNPNPLCSAFVNACVESGRPRLDDLNGPGGNGVGWFDLALDADGGRADAAAVYLRSLRGSSRLTIRTGAVVERLLVEAGAVRALRVRTGETAEEISVDGAEVILCGGAIGSPVLLMRSGLGPASVLSAAGVEVVVDLPGVGANLQDHPLMPVVWSTEHPLPPPTAQWFEAQLVLRNEPRTGGQHIATAFGHLPFLPPGAAAPDFGGTALVGLYGPHSTGSVRLDPDAPDGPALIDPGFLTDERDVNALVAGLEIVREMAAQPALTPFELRELVPGRLTDGGAEAAVRQITGSFFHPVGTCALGDGPDAVVDRDLVVRGVENLRVADSSVIPRIPSVATSATAQMIGWRLAEKLLH